MDSIIGRSNEHQHTNRNKPQCGAGATKRTKSHANMPTAGATL